MDVPDEVVLDVDMLADDGSEDDGEAPPSSEFYLGPASTPTSCASSPRGEEPASPHGSTGQLSFFHHQPYARPFFTSARRGPGRPRKEGVKLAKEGKIVRRYKNPGSVRGAKRHRGSRDDALDEVLDDDDFTMPAPSEEPPYFPEKWTGKLCALCNLGERSQLGQGDMLQFICSIGELEPPPSVPSSGAATPTNPAGTPTGTPTPTTPSTPGLGSPELVDPNQHPLAMPLSRRQKGYNKCKTPLYNMEHTDELSIIGHQEAQEMIAVVSNRFFYVHSKCLKFSAAQDQTAAVPSPEDEKDQTAEDARVRVIVAIALQRKCAFCQKHGASLACKMTCNKFFHLPCVLASGGFMDFPALLSFCKDHLYQVPLICPSDVECRMCRVVGDVANLMTCAACGAHYHGTCVGLAQLPGVRSGWCCRACRCCQICRGEAGGAGGAEPRAVACEHCDKLYHAACLRPPITTVPKYGWKCKCCRVCSDCGARSPGAGPSSRWHAHYTVCDSCYQQRNKGSCCPLCRRAYRAAAMRDMIRCHTCKRYVHGTCDNDAEPAQYRERKQQNPLYEYHCPMCKTQAILTGSNTSFEEENMPSTSQDSSFGDDNSQEQDPLAIETKSDVGLGKGKPYTASKVAKKKLGGYKHKGGFSAAGKMGFQKRCRSSLSEFGRKRTSKPKMRGVFGVPGLGLQRPQAPDNKTPEDDPGVENKLVLCSSKDKFVLTQDLCVMCGAVGTDSEGCLIACAQCGQSYHPYCVNIKVSSVIVSLGWRCLDCTVCEGCGSRGDDALLVLCDDCDTAWHTYCATPALGEVPRGPWRCERCRRCLLCGTRAAKSWCDNYTECGPCASFVMCCVCSEPYSDGELIIQCLQCKRWLHAACDSIRNERDAEICCRADYNCVLCRGVAVPPPHVSLSPPRSPPRAPAPPRPAHLTPQALGLGGEYYVDEVCLSQRGAQHMKQLEAEMGITHARRKRRFKNDDKEAVVQSADADAEESKPDSSTVDVKEEPGAAPYKEGIMWNVSTDGPPPEGFTIYTMETGVTVLRRKRQRNLNKLGIGGFVVRQRQTTLKQQAEDEKDGDGTQAGESPSNKRKPRRKLRSKLMEQFPSYMQEAFFGKELLESKPAVSSTGNPLEVAASSLRPATPEGYRELRDLQVNFDSESDDEELTQALSGGPADDTLLTLNADEIKLLDSLQPKEDPDAARVKTEIPEEEPLKHTEDSTALRNAILGPQSAEVTEQPANTESIPTVHSSKTEAISDAGGSSQTSTISPKDELSLMGVSLDAMVRDSLPDMDGTDVEEIFKGVLTDDSQESQESSVSYATSMAGTPYSQQRQQLQSPMEYASPYHHEFGSGNSALSPAFSESGAAAWGEAPASAPTPSYNQRSAEKMKADESLGSAATISAVLYANTNHPEWRTEFPSWQDRCKQILKKWRALPADQKAPYLQQARDNRSAIRMRKAQQSSPSGSASGPAGASSPASPPPPPPAAAAPPPPLPPPPPSPAVTSAAPVRAPNVTVTAGGLLEADAHIRVLTPSEIMRTLPPLHQAHTEQERACGQQRSAREAEQERQWKQLQQMRQLQTQQQQQIIHDQRAQDGVAESQMCPLYASDSRPQQSAHHRLRAPDGSELPPLPALPEGAPRSAFPAQRFPHHYGNSEDINRQLRDLLQRHPDKSWPPQGGVDDGSVQQVNMEGQPFRHPLPVGGVAVRPRPPLLPGQQLIMQQRLVAPENPQIQHNPQMQNQQEQKPNVIVQPNAQGDSKPESAGTQEQGRDEIDMGDMEKLEQDTANIGEVGDILTGLGGEDDEELLVSLTAEMGEEFNILEYADPELASLDDAEHILDGLELAEETTTRHAKREPPEEIDEKPDIKAAADLQPKPEPAKGEGPQRVGTQMWQETMNRYISQLQQKQQQQQQQPQMQHIKTEVKVEGGATEWRAAPAQPGHFQQRLVHQHALQQQGQLQRPAQFAGGSLQQQMQPRQFAPGPQHMHAQQGGVQTVQNVQNINTQNIVNAMTAQVNAAIAAGRNVVQGNKCVGADGSVGIVRHDRSVALVSLPGQAGVSRAPPPPPYPGTLRPPQPPPPPYPQQVGYEADGWADWLQRRPLLLQNVNQEQPLLLEELLEQEKREQETGGGGPLLTGAGSAGVEWAAAPAPAAPLYSRAPPPQPPPPDPPGDLRARRLYESWLQQYKAFATDQLNYYEQEVTKLRKIRKSLNSKQRQLRKSGNELAPNDAAELRRVSTEQSALQKHLESARKQARQHSMLIQEYETKQRQNNPAPLNNQTNQIFAQNQNMTASPQLQQQGGINRPMQIGLQNTNVQQQQTLIRTQQVIGSDGQLSQQRIGLVTSPMGAQGRILQGVQGGRTLVIEQAAGQQQQLVRQLSATQERPQSVGMVQFGQQQLSGARPAGNAPRPQSRPAMSPLHVQSPHSQSPLHSLAPQSPLHHLTSPMQSPLHSQQSPLHHTAQSLLHPSTQSPLHTQQSPLHSQQSPLQMQQTNLPQQSPMHQSPMHQSPMHQSPLHQSPLQHHQQQMQSQSPLHMQQSPMHSQQSPMHTQQSPMQSAMSPQHFLQQLQAQRTSPQLPTPSRSPQIYQQGAMSSPVSSHSPQLQSGEYGGGRFPRPSPGCSPLQGRFARPPLHQQGMRAGGPFGGRQTSPHGSPQSMPSPGNPANEMARQLRQQYSPMPAAPPSPHPARSPRPSPAPSPAGSEHGGGGHHMQAMPMPPGYRYFKPGLFGGAPVWPDRDGRLPHINKVSILKRTNTPPRQRFTGKTAPPPEEEAGDSREYVLYAPDGVDYAPVDDNRMSFDDDDVEEIVEEHLDDADIVVVEPAAISPQERIATEEDFEELIDSGKPEDEEDEPAPAEKATRTETTTKTVAVISLSTAKQSPNVQQYKLMNPTQSSSLSRLPLLSATVLSPHANTKMLNEVSQATVASVSIANQTISVPVLKNFPRSGVPGHSGGLSKQQLKKMPLNITNTPMSINMSKTILANPSSYISVISPSVPKVATVSPVISLATSNTTGTPVSILSQHQVKQKIVKTIEKPMGLSLSNTKLSSLSVTHDVTLPAKIFQDDAASPDSTVALETNPEKDLPLPSMTQPEPLSPPPKEPRKDIDIESEISQQTELPPALCLTDGTPLLLGKSDIKSPDPIPEKIPDNIMEGDDDDKPEETLPDLLLAYNKPAAPEPATAGPSATRPPKRDEPDLQTIKAIANQTKEMVIGSNMQITTDMAQDSVQISIPSPTPSQERYLNDMAQRNVVDNTKNDESFEDMLSLIENISDEPKMYAKPAPKPSLPPPSLPPPKTETKQPEPAPKPSPPERNVQQATVPQLSPLSQQAELNSSMANVSQQLRTIMSSLNPPAKAEPLSAPAAKILDTMAPTQVNFENLLPSSKVEVPVSRPSPLQRNEKPGSLMPNAESTHISAAQMIGSRVNTLSSMAQNRKSPTASPMNSPAAMQNVGTLTKSPAQSPLISNQGFAPTEDTTTTIASQIIQMPALSKINSNSTVPPMPMIHSNTVTTSSGGFQNTQVLPTSILGHTLLQPARQISATNLPFNTQSISSSQPPALVMTSRPTLGNKEAPPNVTVRPHNVITTGMPQVAGAKPSGTINFITSSKLLHTQLTSPLKRSKSTDEPKTEAVVGHIQPTKRHSVESVIVKSEPVETDDSSTPGASDKQLTAAQRHDESQNVLLKQLLQTSTATAATVPPRNMNIQRTAPALGTIPSLEAQLARPSIPPAMTIAQEVEPPKNSPRQMAPQSTVFNTRPIQSPAMTTVPSSMSPLIQTSTQSLMDVRKPPPIKVLKEETTPQPESSPVMKTMYQLNLENQQQLHQQHQQQQQQQQQLLQQPQHMQHQQIQQQQIHQQHQTQQQHQIHQQHQMQQNQHIQQPQHQLHLQQQQIQQLQHMQQLQQMMKKEVAAPQQSPVHRPFTPMDVKKELLDESSQQSATSGVSTASDQGKLDQPIKEEFPENVSMDISSEANAPETPSEAKKRKRREYQQKKRKMLLNMKAQADNTMSATVKKRPRKGSRFEEDYDTFIDNLISQLRLIPPMQIQEPTLNTNFAVCPLFGSGELTKLKNKDYDTLKGDLTGSFGNAKIPNVGDYYNTKPFGEDEPLPERPPASTQRGFYDQEFQPITFEDDTDEKKLEFTCKERDTDTPDTIVSCSSPECLEIDPPERFPGLRLIDDEDDDDDSDSGISGRVSPIVPLIAPVPIRLKPVSLCQLKEEETALVKVEETIKTNPSSPGSESSENVTVTLTLTSGAAEDILGVLKELAGILHIPPPTAYQIVERTATPPSHKLGLYRSKGKDGKEGAPIDIQSILNGAAKFCRHCDVVILDSVVRAKASEFPLLSENKEGILCDSDSELFFCSAQCYERFSWRPTNIILDGKSKTTVKDEKCETDPNVSKERDDFDTASTESMETDDLDIKPDIKDEKMDLFIDSLDNDELMKEVGDDVTLDEDIKQEDKPTEPVVKEKFRGIVYKAWSPNCIGPTVKYKRPTDRELAELVFRTGVAIMPVTNEDSRRCELCGIQGDGVADGVARLLNCDVDRWVHLNCALWSEGVYETVSGALMNVDSALAAGSNATCAVCRRLGATVRCFKVRCGSVYHLGCAVKDSCVFYKNKTAYCASHAPKGEKDNELTTLSVQRRVFISRDEQRQVASVMLHSDSNHLIRVGGLIFLSPGHLLPHQLATFHTPNYIYPPGYKCVRFYWSMSRANSRCRYLCWISDEAGRPMFHVRAQDDQRDDMTAPTARAAWSKVLDAVAALRESRTEEGVLKLWPNYVTGEDLFGLTEPAVVRVLESLPGIETLTDYRFKFGRSALLEGGLAVNPHGCARAAPRPRAAAAPFRRAAPRAAPAAAGPAPAPASTDLACPYTKQFVHTKSSQYKKMKSEWRNNVYLARSKIQGLGLFAARDLEKHTMIIEYIGEIIRSELSEKREKMYEARNRGIYMFRLDERRVVDATISGGLARYINHSCQPNCVTELVELERTLKIVIFAKRHIHRGEELAYDYKFDIEDDAHKIMCMCGAPNCRKWMN